MQGPFRPPYPLEIEPVHPFRGIHSFTVEKDLFTLKCLYSELNECLEIHLRWQETGQWYQLTINQVNLVRVVPWFRTTQQLYSFMHSKQGKGCSFDPRSAMISIRDNTARAETVRILMLSRKSTPTELTEYKYVKIEEQNMKLKREVEEVKREILAAQLRWKITCQRMKEIEEENKQLRIELEQTRAIKAQMQTQKSQYTRADSEINKQEEKEEMESEDEGWVELILSNKKKHLLHEAYVQIGSANQPTRPEVSSQIDSSPEATSMG